jgi:hypothetical protein
VEGRKPLHIFTYKIKVMSITNKDGYEYMYMGRHKVTVRHQINDDLSKMIGRTLRTCLLPTYLGKLLYIQDDKCYFEVLPNPEFTRYNGCAGQVEYINEHHVVTMKFEETE